MPRAKKKTARKKVELPEPCEHGLDDAFLLPGINHEDVTPPEERYKILMDRKMPLPSDQLVKSVWNSLYLDLREMGVKVCCLRQAKKAMQIEWAEHPIRGHLVVWHYAEQRARMRGGMFWFAREILRQRKLYRAVHDYHLCHYLERSLNTPDKLHFRWHRGSFKSTVVAYAAPLWAMGVDPKQSILLSQATDKDINKSMKRIRRTIETKARIYALFPYILPAISPITKKNIQWDERALLTMGKDKESDDAVEGDFSIVGISTHGSATGWHPSCVIGDDLHTVGNTGSAVQIGRVVDFWEDATGPAKSTGCPVWLIDTPWTIDDLGSEIDNGKYGDYHSSIMPVKRELPIGSGREYYMLPTEKIREQLYACIQCRKQESACKCKVFKNESHLYAKDRGFDAAVDEEKRVACGSYFKYMAQYMCQPVPPGEVHFADGSWRTWTDEEGKAPWNHPNFPKYEDELQAKAAWLGTLRKFGFWDPAVALHRTSDYTAAGIVGISSTGIVYVLDYVYDKLPPRMSIEMIHQMFLPPTRGMPRFWRDRWVWPTPENPDLARHERCWQPEFVVTDKGQMEQSFKGGIEEREFNIGYKYRLWGTYHKKGAGKSDWILKSLDRYFSDHMIRVRAPLLKKSVTDGGRIVDISKKVEREHSWFMRDPTPDDFLDGLAMSSYYWTGGFRPKMERTVVPKSEGELMLEGFLRPATDDDVIPGMIEEGMPIPIAPSSPIDTVVTDMEDWTRQFYRSIGGDY